MANFKKMLAGAGLGLALVSGAALAGGFFTNGVPPAGGSQYPTTLPLTGNETIPADTNLSSGLNPQSESITTGQLAAYAASASSSITNSLVCGDFGVCPWQRGTSFATIANTLTFTADRWYALGGASSSIDVTQQTGASDIIPGSAASLRFSRTASNANTASIQLGQALTSNMSTRLQGQQVELTFWAKAGATFSAASSQITATIAYGTGSDESTANFAAGTWTGYTAAVAQATTISTTWTRYSAVATIPTTATQVGVKFAYTPVGTAGATDYVEFANVQLTPNAAAVAYAGTGSATGNMVAFGYRPPELETALAQRFYFGVTETNGGYFAAGMVSASNVERAVLMFPTTMRTTPTCTFTAGGFKWDLNGTDTAVGTLTQVTGSTAQFLTIGDTTTGTAGQTAFLLGSNTTGSIKCSAEL